jgi:hypothetical protein
LVALIVAAVAWTVNDRSGSVSDSATTATSTPPIAVASDTHAIVELGITASKADRDQRLRIDLDAGSSTAVSVPAGWRATDLTASPDVSIVPSGDGFKLSGADWDIMLRRENGELYIEPQLLGLFDPTHAAVVARVSASQELLSVNRAGSISKISDVPDNANVLGLSGGSVWLSTFIPGEGIESEPHGPSKLVQITRDGTQTPLATSESVINRVVASGSDAAYGTEGGTFAVAGANDWTGDGVPLVWLSGHRLLVLRGTSLFVTGGAGDERRISGTVSGQPSAAVVVE